MSGLQHAELAKKLTDDSARTDWHNNALWWVRTNRDKAVFGIPDWEKLREAASEIKEYVLANLHDLLLEFEKNAQKNGIQVHWAADDKEHNEIVYRILSNHSVKKLVKSKSMLTEECGMNHFLEAKGIEVIDTDLGERIIQLRNEPPSHIVMPAIHLKKEDVSETFHEKLGTEKGNADPQYLTEAARQSLRKDFLTADAALTGVNFAVAETGEFVVCTNEGNADMGAHLAPVHIASMGLEKIIPKRNHLSVFLRVLARSSTGQAITTYSSHFRKPRKGQEMHLILVDNGRSRHLTLPQFKTALKCIRCGACMNTCPVYRRSGGHSYHMTVPGPIGSVLAPNKDLKAYSDLPFASTLCGACSNVCPVKINIHDQLYAWRQEIGKSGYVPAGKTIGIKAMNFVLSKPGLFNLGGEIGRKVMRAVPFIINNGLNPWYRSREMPEPPKESFREWYNKNRVKQ
jgi:L-lactate dehydrogenase complex protein LldF